jgi:hypothetical protein
MVFPHEVVQRYEAVEMRHGEADRHRNALRPQHAAARVFLARDRLADGKLLIHQQRGSNGTFIRGAFVNEARRTATRYSV